MLASASYVLADNVDELGLTGARDLNGRGNDAANVVRGNNGANVLRGMGGDDALSGLGGDDLLIGGGGRDLLSGGYGDDVYRFVSVADSSSARRDKILEFWSGQDVIDLAAIDANEGRAGKQGFVFLENAEFSGRAGELRVSTGQVSADVDGDRRADLIIDVHERLLLERADFIL